MDQQRIFLHANGYPPACYKQLLDLLQPIDALPLRPLWEGSKPEEIDDWHPIAHDLIKHLDDQRIDQAIVIGHSLGGITALRAALMRPEKFRAIILLDPVLFPPYFILGWNVIRALGLGMRMHPLIASAQTRRRKFDSLEKAFAGYRRRSIFRYMSDDALRIYLKGITRPAVDGGYELVYSPEWETRIYYTGVWRDLELWRSLKNLKTPTLIIRGAETDTFYESAGIKARGLNPTIQVEAIKHATHLVPLERPHEVNHLIQQFIRQLSD